MIILYFKRREKQSLADILKGYSFVRILLDKILRRIMR